MPFVPLQQSYKTNTDLAQAVLLTPEERQWGEEKGTHDTELAREIEHAKDPKVKQVLLDEQQKRAAAKPVVSPVKRGFTPLEASDKPELTPAQEMDALNAPGKKLFQDISNKSLIPTLQRFGEATGKIDEAKKAVLAVDERTGKSMLDQEKERMAKAGTPADMGYLNAWVHSKATEIAFGKQPEGASLYGQFQELVKQAKEKPLEFTKSLMLGMASHPEYLIAPWMVPLESYAEQVGETGRADPQKVLFDTLTVALPIGAAKVTGQVLKSAIHVGQDAAAKVKGATTTPEVEVKAAQDVAAKVESGTPPVQATDEVLKAMGVPDPVREKIVQDAHEVIEQAKEPEHAPEERKVEEDNQPQHQRTDTPREPETVSQADSGDRVEPSAEVRPKEEAPVDHSAAAIDAIGQARAARFRQLNQKVMGGEKLTDVETKDFDRLHKEITQKAAALADKTKESTVTPLFKPLPEGLDPKRWVTPEETRTVLKEAGLDEEAANAIAGDKPISIGALRQRLTKFMSGQRYADNVLADVLVRGGKQSGKADPKLLAAMAAVGLGAAGAYALTQDKSKAVETAMWLGAGVAAVAVVGRLGRSVDSLLSDTRFGKAVIAPFKEYLARPQMVEHAIQNWERSTDALLTGIKDKNASRVKVRDWLQGHRDMELTPQEMEYAKAIQDRLNVWGDFFYDAGQLRQLRENYLTGLYQKKPFMKWSDIMRELTTDQAFKGNYTGMGRNSRFNLQKVIPDYRTAEALTREGKFPLIPLTNDPVRIAGHYARSMYKTWSVNKLIADLKNTSSNLRWAKTGIPVPVIISMADLAKDTIVRDTVDTAARLGADKETGQAMAKTARLNAHNDYVMVRHPSLNGLMVHKDIAGPMKMLFDTSDPTQIHKALYATSMAGKSLFFTVSFFHPVALGVVAATVALPRVSRLVTGMPKYWKEIPAARAQLKSSAGAPQVELAAKGGLEFLKPPQDMDPHIVSRILNYGEHTLGPLGLPLKGMRVVNDWVQNFLWNELFPTLKLASFNAEYASALKKNPKLDPETAAHEVAQGVNDLFGGQNWFHLVNDIPEGMTRTLAQAVFSPYSRRVQQIMFLSPDWNISAARAWYQGIKSVVPGVTKKASDSMYQSYLMWSALTYLGASQMLAQHYTGHNIWDQKDWTYVQRGDGTKIQLNKHFMEMVHLVSNPKGFFLNKLNLMPREAIEQFFGKEWVAWDNEKGQIYGPPMTQYPFHLTRPAHAAKTFIPLSIANIMRDPGAGLSGMFSFGIYGTPYSQREEQAVEKAREKGEDEEKAREKERKRIETSRQKLYRDYVPPPKKRKVNPDADIVQ